MKPIRRSRTTRNVTIGSVVLVLGAGLIMLRDRKPSPQPAAPPGPGIALRGVPNGNTAQPPAARAASQAEAAAPTAVPAAPGTAAAQPQPVSDEGVRLFTLAQERAANQDLVAARTQYNQAIQSGLPPELGNRARARLVELAEALLFSPRRGADDPLVTSYVIQPGDTLQEIAKEYFITAALLGRINNLQNLNQIRAGQSLKVLRGPFHATVNKATYGMDVYLQDTLVRHFPVGLGVEGSTPAGVWAVTHKLVNPTYYSPIGEGIIEANDPNNPLGERWIGLEGISGDAVGALRYGIHGTNDPSTIGKNASLGCVRLYNDDATWVFDALVATHSRVTIMER